MARIEEYQHIEMMIELDKGRRFEEVAEQFDVSVSYLRKLAAKAGMIAPQKRRKVSKKEVLFEEDHERILERVTEGDSLDSIALDFNISIKSIQKLCKQEGVIIPRSLKQLNSGELEEIQALLGSGEAIEEIARAFKLAVFALEQLKFEEYKQLDSETLAYLYEIIIENKKTSSRSLKRIAKNEGYTISESAILSYQNRLKKLKII
ncbi:MAG: LysM peptidoglycan-binding domain-containing protein [SAR324 cluster bacterium]|nr:LysM peptidoglycan-binding domain-containing protein [SAR324 cluster bacterium]